MKWIKYGGLFLLALLIESKFSNFYALGNHTPDLFVILVIYISLREGKISGTISGFSIGLIQDLIFSVGFLGLSSFSKSLSGFLVGFFTNSRRARIYPGILIPAIIGISVSHIFTSVFHSAGSEEGIISSVFRVSLPSAIYTLIVANFVLMILKSEMDDE